MNRCLVFSPVYTYKLCIQTGEQKVIQDNDSCHLKKCFSIESLQNENKF